MGEVTEASWLGKGLGPVEPFGGGEGAGLPSAIASGANMLSILHSAIFCHILSVNLVPRKKTKSECAAAFKLPCGKGGSSGSVRPKGPILRKLTGGKWPLQLCPRVMFGHRYLGLQRPRWHSWKLWKTWPLGRGLHASSNNEIYPQASHAWLCTYYIYILVEKINAMQFHTGTWTYIIIAILW